ncbi:MAG: adenylosuccinate lyase [Bacteroidia bacterium]|nr:adenylosuccinate lyase [Bacteroidia bacterium]
MNLHPLNAISPIDGRYRNSCEELALYFSEEALMRYRVLVEVEYFIELCELPLPQLKQFDKNKFKALRSIYNDFKHEDGLHIKSIEKTTNHDVKAVEYFLKEKFDSLGLQEHKEFIHFGLTSQDINNTAIPLSILEANTQIYLPAIKAISEKIQLVAKDWKDIPMLARTHGQPASPTRLGKEIYIFHHRLQAQLELLNSITSSAKFGGATGNFNAHAVAYPEIDWIAFSDRFIHRLGLQRSTYTTQIEHYDNMAALFDSMKRINTILVDLSRDMWTYISMNYFTQKVVANEVGSSAMPHKVNPIDFENAEGNLGMANALFEHLAAKLPVSRLQRDLTDSTVLRNVGVPYAHTLIACKSLLKGFNKISVNADIIQQDLSENWAVVAEAIQTILRREAFPNPYEALKSLTRTGEKINPDTISKFIDGLDISDKLKTELRKITPFNSTGVVKEF